MIATRRCIRAARYVGRTLGRARRHFYTRLAVDAVIIGGEDGMPRQQE